MDSVGGGGVVAEFSGIHILWGGVFFSGIHILWGPTNFSVNSSNRP